MEELQIQNARDLCDLSEEEISKLEETLGCTIKRPTPEQRKRWLKYKTKFKIHGTWKLDLPMAGRRRNQDSLDDNSSNI